MEEEKKWCVYIHTNKINNKVYIGQTCLSLEERSDHGKGYQNCRYFYNAIQKYGWHNFAHEILYENLTLEEANAIEEKMIKYYDSTNPTKGYNLRPGGQNSTHSEETKEILRQKFSGENNPNWGKKMPKSSREKMSNAHKNKKLSKEHREHISKSNLGRTFSKETRQKISDSMKGEKNHMYGKHHSQATILKKSKPIVCIETNTIYLSSTEASRILRISQGGISNCCKGTQKSCGGFHWRFATEEESKEIKANLKK